MPLLSRSTRDFLNEGRRARNYTWFDALHGYVYTRWLYLYISLALGEHPLAKRLGPALGWLGAH